MSCAYHTMLLYPEFIAEGMTGLNICIRALLIDEADELSQKISEYLDKLKCIEMWSSKYRQSWVIPEIHHIGNEGTSFRSVNFCTTCSSWTKAT